MKNILNTLKLNMSLRESIESDYKTALKAKDKNKISTYRLILSGIKDLDINNRSGTEKKETVDEDIKKLLKKMIKQRSESIELYKKNNRKDLQDIEEQEVDVISQYLPKQISEEDTKKICEEVIKSTGANSIKDMGKAMGELKKNYADSIDFSKAGAIIKDLLNQK
ncbi:GatB/YqeY domain-containing protein [Candidatus Pelagibacter sp.]|nr:GatB/YqeY domain-containing protein [Candidatus Pelagibacter sp.]